MNNIAKNLTLPFLFLGLLAFKAPNGKLVSKTGQINFFSHTVAEDISSDNFAGQKLIGRSRGKLQYLVFLSVI